MKNNDFLTSFKELLYRLSEDSLILVSNKGTLKRALKDLENDVNIEVSIGDSCVACILPDKTKVHLTNEVKKSTCSCPSAKICKHILYSYLFLKKNYKSTFKESQKEYSFDTKAILNIKSEDLIKKLGTRKYNDIVFRLAFDVDISIEENNGLIIRFPNEDIYVELSAKDPLSASICSCKSDSLCMHCGEAIIRYQIAKGSKKTKDFQEHIKVNIHSDTLSAIEKLLSEIIITGLARLPDSITNRIEQKAIICHTHNLPGLEKILRSVGNELKLFFNKSASFSAGRHRYYLTRAFAICSVLKKKNDTDLISPLLEHRSSYISIPVLSLTGMGSGTWETKSGYSGETIYFISNKKKWYTLTQSRPTFYQDSKRETDDTPWDSQLSMKELSHSRIKLVHAKLNRNYRLSTSKNTKAYILSNVNLSFINTLGIAYDNWAQLFKDKKESFSYSMIFENSINENIALLKINEWDQSSFDSIEQVFRQSVFDSNRNRIEIVLEYNDINKRIIEKLEEKEKNGKLPEFLLVKLFIASSINRLMAIPVVAYTNDLIENLSMDY